MGVNLFLYLTECITYGYLRLSEYKCQQMANFSSLKFEQAVLCKYIDKDKSRKLFRKFFLDYPI